jgi:hypothetical protein
MDKYQVSWYLPWYPLKGRPFEKQDTKSRMSLHPNVFYGHLGILLDIPKIPISGRQYETH